MTFKMVGDAAPSPKMIDHYVRGFTAGLGQQVLAVLDQGYYYITGLEATNSRMFVIRRFFGEVKDVPGKGALNRQANQAIFNINQITTSLRNKSLEKRQMRKEDLS